MTPPSADKTQVLQIKPAGGAKGRATATVHAVPLARRLEQLVEVGTSLSAERNIDRLLQMILTAAKSITRADGGTLYRVTAGRTLRFEIVRTTSLNIFLGGTTGNPINFPELPLYKADGAPNHQMVAAHAALTGKTVRIADAYQEPGFDFSGTRAFDQKTGYRSQSFLTVPLKNHEEEIIGVLQLINAKAPGGEDTVPFSDEDQRLAESLASQAAIALTNRMLIDQLAQLFESFIGMINAAIDEKSPYTGGHCQRVPTLTMLLAEAAHRKDSGPLADFSMTDRDQYELKIAGLLHDCGKVTTPVHVVDKGTKLETIFDRIGLVATRFEVAKRDAEIAMLRRVATLRASGDELGVRREEEACAAFVREMDEDLKFLRTSNVGGERMRDEDVERVRRIAARRWRDADGAEQPLLTDNEVENLTIRAGTLTGPEREVINNHISTTIRMLEALPWPKHLTKVPEYAGGHHERMDGKGYPRGLTRDQMSWQARMIGIADIFEALTAADRPYKKGKTLSEALKIMGFMCKDAHIDPDLFDLFIREKIYLEYAKQFLAPEQIDAVDETKIPNYRP